MLPTYAHHMHLHPGVLMDATDARYQCRNLQKIPASILYPSVWLQADHVGSGTLSSRALVMMMSGRACAEAAPEEWPESRRPADVPLRQCGMTLLKCYHVCRVHRSSVHTAQSIRLRGVQPALGRRSSLRVRAASAAGTQGAEGNVIQEGPRCYLEPTDNGQGLVEICVSEGRLDIGVADSDYYFTAFTGRQGHVLLYWSHDQAVLPCLHCRHDCLTVQCALQCQRGN